MLSSFVSLIHINLHFSNQMYSWLVKGTIQYKNGFLISVESMDVSGISFVVTRKPTNDSVEYHAGLKATINLRNSRIGLDILTDLENMDKQLYTGTFMYRSISLPISVRWFNVYLCFSDKELVLSDYQLTRINRSKFKNPGCLLIQKNIFLIKFKILDSFRDIRFLYKCH